MVTSPRPTVGSSGSAGRPAAARAAASGSVTAATWGARGVIPNSIPIDTAIAVVYIAVNGSLSFLARRLDRYTRRQYGRTVQPSVADEVA